MSEKITSMIYPWDHGNEVLKFEPVTCPHCGQVVRARIEEVPAEREDHCRFRFSADICQPKDTG